MLPKNSAMGGLPVIVFVGTFSSIIYFKQLCNKRSFLGTTTLEKKEQIKKEEERGIVWQCVWRDPRWFSCHCWLIFQESALWSALNHFDISSLLYTISGRLTIPLRDSVLTLYKVYTYSQVHIFELYYFFSSYILWILNILFINYTKHNTQDEVNQTKYVLL